MPDEDEKTTLEAEAEWADEPSTTIEQGDAKLGGNSLITSVTGASLDEHTVDEQNQNLISAITPPARAPARLVITAGNDTGITQDLLTDKAYTIGRGIDNDLVLTDIAVSRKHFDLRCEDGSWVIADRGSGNGTVVNGSLEDNPFTLANGDSIEIGTTTFRFDLVTAPRPAGSSSQLDGFASDDDEMSTVAGKPLTGKPLDSVDVRLDTPPRVQPMRPQTLPPPVVGARTLSKHDGHPARGGASPQGTPGPLPATTLPLPQMSNRVGPHAPTLLSGEPLRPLHAQLPAQAMYGTGSGYSQPGGYPQANEIPPHSVHAQMLVAAQLNQRGDHSTAHVQPVAYNSGLVAQPAPRFTPPPLSKRAKLTVLFGGLAVAALFTTIAAIKSGSAPKTASIPVAAKTAGGTTPSRLIARPTATPIEPAKPEPPRQEATKIEPKPLAKIEPTPVAKVEPKPVAKVEPKVQPKPATPKQAPPQPTNARKVTAVKVDRPEPPKQEPPTPKADKRVATAEAASDRAESLYRDRKFSDASNLLTEAARSADASDARDLRVKSQKITLFAKVFNTAMAPGSKAKEVFDQLQTATNYDQSLGGFFQADIAARLQTIIGKAAVGFFGAGNFDKAHQVVAKADAIGAGGDNNIKLVRQNLEAKAQQLYGEAMSAQSANPAEAKDKLKQVKGMTDSKSPINQKATKALGGG